MERATMAKVIDLKTGKSPRLLGIERLGFTVRDLAFLLRVWAAPPDDPCPARRGEKAAAERLRRAGWLHQRSGAEETGYLLTVGGQELLERLCLELERRAAR